MSLRILRGPPRGPLLALNSSGHFASFLLAVLVWLAAGAHAESVALAGMLGSKTLLVVNGSAPKTVAAGETHQGVKFPPRATRRSSSSSASARRCGSVKRP